ncbi:LysR family transcriptional regulator [uncultured Ruegeria sp.]|uniref:LysR family transcriptional regulator n=1 Tax=uncultured Ruegeria sp. TaxID=259304 RepID=UPI00262ADDCD|nr:LysR family transcriptional regulator [uncultured Ruegeria sp.]
MDISLKALRYFMAAAECGSLTEASKKMHVVPSAILAAVNQVEEAFGLQLTIRHRSKGIAPTSTGKIIMARVQHLLDEYEALMSQGAEMRTQLIGTLRVGYYAPVAPAFLPSIAQNLLAYNPRVEIKFIECDTHSAQAGLLSGDFDVILCVAESMAPDVAYETLIEVPAYLLVPEQHRFASRTDVSLSELNDEPMVLLDLPVISDYYSRVFEAAGVTPHVACTATTLEMVRSLVGMGVGCSLLHMRPKTHVTYAGENVIEVPLYPATDQLKIVLGYLPDNPRRVVKHFTDSLRDLFSKEEANRLLVTP